MSPKPDSPEAEVGAADSPSSSSMVPGFGSPANAAATLERFADDAPLRIGLVVSYFHPFASGAEKQALAQGIELARRGHRVHVLTQAVDGYPIEDEEYRGVFIHRWIRAWHRGPLFGPSYVASALWGLRRLRSELDLVHTHQGLWEAVATGTARPWLAGCPTLVQPASSGEYGEAFALQRARGTALLRRAILANSAFAAISADIEREWLEIGVPAGRIIRTASGVDTERFRPGPSVLEDCLLPRPRVIFTGRLHPQKNLPLLLDAWSQVARRSSANLIVVGPGDSAPLADQARALGIADRLQFVGPVADPADHLRAADLFVLPSVAEGMSNSLLEAMATALPCAVSGIGGNTDLIEDGDNGRLVNPATPEAWTAALLDLLGNPDRLQRYGQRARALIDERFSIRAVVDHYIRIYRNLIAANGQNLQPPLA
jgi:glycosyltransferase involved in cell wall biosynthesis